MSAPSLTSRSTALSLIDHTLLSAAQPARTSLIRLMWPASSAMIATAAESWRIHSICSAEEVS